MRSSGAARPSVPPVVAVRLIVIRDDPRARVLLADVAGRLGLGPLEPDEHSDVLLEPRASGDAEAWQRVRDALDAAGDDWWAYFHLPPHAAPAGDA
jgi:hypothetical protein